MTKKEFVKDYVDSEFPWKFAICILVLIPLSTIICFVGAALGGIASLFVILPLGAFAHSGHNSISPDTLSLAMIIIYRSAIIAGALALIGYCINTIGEITYDFYGRRTRSSLFITLAVITAISIISELLIAILLFVQNSDVISMFGLTNLISKVCSAETTHAINIVIKLTFLCIPISLLSLVVKMLVMDRDYSCTLCGLTNSLSYDDHVLSSHEKMVGYWEDGGYRTDNYTINGENFSVTYQDSPTYKTKRVGYMDKEHICTCLVCKHKHTWVQRHHYES